MRITNPTAILGEDAASTYLQRKGYKILERNFRKGYGEIDIISIYKNVLVFVEVKTRSSDRFGTPFESISKKKLQKVVSGAKYYKYILHPEFPDDIRIDAVGVTVSKGNVISIEHIENLTEVS